MPQRRSASKPARPVKEPHAEVTTHAVRQFTSSSGIPDWRIN
jgi:hypothetical protein